MKLLKSPWEEDFERFARSIDGSALIVAPYISKGALEHLSSHLSHRRISTEVHILTDLAIDSVLQGSTDVSAIAEFCRGNAKVEVRTLPRLHAKVYIADDHCAIITSGNLTTSSLAVNWEYGVLVTDTNEVRQIARNLRAYWDLGTNVSVEQLDRLHRTVASSQVSLRKAFQDARAQFSDEFADILKGPTESLVLEGPTTVHAVFAKSILRFLGEAPLTTKCIYHQIEREHPNLCDNSKFTIIKGVPNEIEWKHTVRLAQQHLKNKGFIKLLGDKRWSLA